MQINVDKDMDLSPEDAKELQQEVDDYQHQLRRFIRTRGVEVKTLGHDGVDPTGVFNLLMSMITAGTGIPSNVLVGNGGRQLEAELDRANWSDRIAERVVEYAEPVILKGLLDNFIYAGALTIPQNIQISWPEAFKMSPLERAQTSAQMARSAVNLTKAAQLSNNNTQGITGQDASIQKPSDDNEDPNTINDDPNGETNQTPQRAGNTPIDPQGQQVQAPSKPLFSHEEMRRMVSFGKHPPVFDSPTPQGDTPSPGSPPPSKSK
jgi:hypothetical protein